MKNEYKRAFSLLGAKISLISNNKSILFDDEYFLGKGAHLYSLLSNFHILNPILNENDTAMEMIFKVVDKPDTEIKFESHGSVYKISGPIKELEDSARDKRASIFGNMGIFSKVVVRELEKLGIFSFHSTSFVHPTTNILYLVLGRSGSGKSTVLLKAITKNLQVFGTELTHIRIVDRRVIFMKGSLWQNCRMGNLVEDFPSLLEKFNINYTPNGNPWQQYISVDMNPWQYPKDIMIDPKVIILYPRIESERNSPERYKLDSADTAGNAYTIFENLSDKVSPPSLLYKKFFIPSVDNREDQIRRMATAEEFIRYANIIAEWKIMTSPDACLDTLL